MERLNSISVELTENIAASTRFIVDDVPSSSKIGTYLKLYPTINVEGEALNSPS